MRLGQRRFALGLEHQRQGGVRVGITAIQGQGLAQRRLGLLGQTLLQITQPKLHIGPPRLCPALAAGQGVARAARHAAGQQRKRKDRQRGAQAHGQGTCQWLAALSGSSTSAESWRTAM
ncbi:hypothetical protein D3C76_571250 [compost metagenome]